MQATQPKRSQFIGGDSEEWPPFFEKHGSLYIFDRRCSMFYEPKSDFFYDPKSTLYYGNKQRAYYRYNTTSRPAFEEVIGTQSQSQSQPEKTEPQSQSPKKKAEADWEQVASSKQQDLPEKTIEVVVKTKKLPKKKSKSAPKSSEVGSQEESCFAKNHAQRQQVANMDKWKVLNAKQEAKQEQSHNRKSSAPSSSEPVSIYKTGKGEPVCTLCMRKFRNMEQLRRHEAASQLHKDNVRKAAELERKKREQERSKPTKRPTPVMQYEDRAKKRRALHGEMQGEGPSGRREAAIMSLKAPQKPWWLKQKGVQGIDIAAELKNVQARFDRANAPATSQVPAISNLNLSVASGVLPRETPMIASIRQVWDRIEEPLSGSRSARQGPTSARNERFGLGFNI
jgi:hypothetical protein